MTTNPTDVRERVRTWTVAELRSAVQSRAGDHPDDEVEAARRELALRISPLSGGTLTDDYEAADDSMPVGLKAMLYLVCCVAVFLCLAFAFFLSIFLASNVNSGMVIAVLLRFGVPAVLATWTASAIHSERYYARGLLLSLLSVAIVAGLVPALLEWEFTWGRLVTISVSGVTFCYVAFSSATRRYYRALKRIEGT